MVAYSFYESDGRIRQYAETLASRGDHVDVIALRRKGQKHFGELKGVDIYRIQKRTVGEKWKLTYLVKALLFLLKSSTFLTLKHLRNHYDLIHVHSVPDFEVFAAFWPKLTGARIILDIHDIVPEFYASKFDTSRTSLPFKLLVLVEKVSVWFSDHVIVPNHIWQQTVHSRSTSPGRCSVMLNYPDPNIFSRKLRVRTARNGKFVLIYPGSLNRHQGLDVAIDAVGRIANQMPDLEFHIYGEGPERASLIYQVSRLGLETRVLFKSPLPVEQIAEKMADADLAIVPKRAVSFGNEAFSTKIPECLALGVPVIASDTKVDRFYFSDSVVQFFRSEDPADLARSIVLLRENESLRKQLIQNGLRFTEQNSAQQRKSDYLDLVDRLVGLPLHSCAHKTPEAM